MTAHRAGVLQAATFLANRELSTHPRGATSPWHPHAFTIAIRPVYTAASELGPSLIYASRPCREWMPAFQSDDPDYRSEYGTCTAAYCDPEAAEASGRVVMVVIVGFGLLICGLIVGTVICCCRGGPGGAGRDDDDDDDDNELTFGEQTHELNPFDGGGGDD